MRKLAFILSLAVIFGLMPSCHHAHEEDEHEHHHHAEQYTLYSDQYEIFAEAEPLMKGEESHIAIHITRLSNFRPLDSVPVKVTLMVGSKSFTSKIDQPTQPGIYKCAFTPSVAGEGRLYIEIPTADSVAHLVIDGIEVFEDHEAFEQHEEEEEHEHAAVANAITFTKEQGWKIGLTTAILQEQPFGSIIKTSARVLPSQGDERQATASASGVIVFANANMVEGTAVKAGQKLFSIESNGMADNNMNVRFQEAASNYNVAKSEYERKQQLAEDKIVTQSELQRAKSAYLNAKAAYDNLKNNFSQKGAIVRAPISGYIQRINVSNGAYVEAGADVVSISQNRDLMLRAEVQPRFYSQLSHIESVNVKLPTSNQVYSLKELGGRVVSYGKATDADCPLIPVTFSVHNDGKLISGSFVTVYITTNSERQVLSIPNKGIVEEMGNYFVFVQINPESFEKRLVTLGATDGINTEILSGVSAGERVVTKGASMVRLAQNAGTLDPHAGHVH